MSGVDSNAGGRSSHDVQTLLRELVGRGLLSAAQAASLRVETPTGLAHEVLRRGWVQREQLAELGRRPGADTAEIMQELGCDLATIERLVEAGLIAVSPAGEETA